MNNYLGMKSKKKVLLSFSCLFLFFCIACGKEYTTNTLEFCSNGEIKQYIIEDFDETVYSMEELNTLNTTQVNELNSKKGSEIVTIDKSELKDGKAKITMTYRDNSSYYDLNTKVIYYGNANGAKNAGYGLSNRVFSVEDNTPLGIDEWSSMINERVIVVSEDVDIKTPSKILFVSEGVTVNGSNEATVNGDSIRYIICK